MDAGGDRYLRFRAMAHLRKSAPAALTDSKLIIPYESTRDTQPRIADRQRPAKSGYPGAHSEWREADIQSRLLRRHRYN